MVFEKSSSFKQLNGMDCGWHVLHVKSRESMDKDTDIMWKI